jgi:hypothetical protein
LIAFVHKFLNAEDYDGKKQKEIAVLEQTIAYQAKVNYILSFILIFLCQIFYLPISATRKSCSTES